MSRLFLLCAIALALAGCQTLGSKPTWLPTVLTDDTPYLQQLSPDNAASALIGVGQDKDVRMMQSTGRCGIQMRRCTFSWQENGSMSKRYA